MPDPKDHYRNRGFLEELGRKIPGFRGYLEREYRRDSDALERQYLADRLQGSKRGLDDVMRALVEAGQVDSLPQFERVRARLDKLIGRIRGAMRGYSGMFDLVHIDEAVLDRVYEHDAGMIEAVDALAERIEAWPQSTGDPAAAVADVLRQIDALETTWDGGDEILKGL